MRRGSIVTMVILLLGAATLPAAAEAPGYEEAPWGDGASCEFGDYGTPGYPEEETQTVLVKRQEVVDGRGTIHGRVSIVMDGVRYDRLDEGDGPESFLVYGTITGTGWFNETEAFGSTVWKWTLTDLEGNPIGTTGGNIVDFDPPDFGRLVHNWRGPCSEP